MMNSEDVYAQVKLRPHARVNLRADVHHLRLSNAKDLWYVGGGAFQEGSFGYVGRPSGGRRGLGTLFDVSADFVINPTTTVTIYAAGVRGSDVQSIIYPAGGVNPTARFVYAEWLCPKSLSRAWPQSVQGAVATRSVPRVIPTVEAKRRGVD